MSGHCVPTLHRKKRLCEEHKTTCYFVCFRKDAGISLEKNSSLSLSFTYTDPGGHISLCLRGPLAIGQAGNLASSPLDTTHVQEYGCQTRNHNDHSIKPYFCGLGWIRAHVGNLGNEKADELAKEAITSTEAAVLTFPPPPRSSAKPDLKQRALAKWQRRWDDGINGRSTYEVIKMVGPQIITGRNSSSNLSQDTGPSDPIFSVSENTRSTAVPVENLACLFTMPPSAASRFLTTSGVQQINTLNPG
ncbi:hypothetical protein AVEN_249426-1 [Araneus ventricosus]|uniref:RNase H type-1 domain-containing protein n=1 Tax=Araneus ventricosus TaxID=182803 RepID=A0A4Y2V959_ARAVE|nr:hypothetical protein AVEN_249426-1 [Araneus ventricosus]